MNAERFQAILSQEIKQLAKFSSKREVYTLLGDAVGREWHSVDRWTTGAVDRVMPLMRKLDYIEKIASKLVELGGLQGELLNEFLVTSGHPNPSAVISPPVIDRPPRDKFFTGRADVLKELLDNVRPGCTVALIGTGGIGKTTLAAEVIHRLAPNDRSCERFPHGIFYYEFDRHPSVSEAFEAIAHRFGTGEITSLNPRDAARESLRNKYALLVLDGAEEADDLNSLLRIRQYCGVLVISRYRPSSSIDHTIILDLLRIEQAIQVLKSWSMEHQEAESSVWSKSDEINDQTARQICEILGRLPLAVQLAGHNLGQYFPNAATFLEILKNSPLALLNKEEHQHHSIPFLLKAMIKRLDQTNKIDEIALKTLAVVGVLSYESFSLEVISTALDLPEHLTQLALNKLVELSLLGSSTRTGRYWVIHRLVHTYVADPKHGLKVPDGATQRLTLYYISFVQKQTGLGVDGYVTLDKERPHVKAILSASEREGAWELIIELIWVIDGYLNRQGHWADRVATLSMGLTAAQSLGIRDKESRLFNRLGNVHRALGEYQQACQYHEQALTIAQEIGDQIVVGTCFNSLANTYSELGEYQTALNYYEQALTIAQEIDDHIMVATCLGNLGSIYNDLGEYQQALQYNERALATAQESGDRTGEGIYSGSLGNVCYNLGEYQSARQYNEQALTIAQEIGNRKEESIHLNTLGNIHFATGKYQTALNYYAQSLTIAQEIGDRSGEAACFSNLGNIRYVQQEYQQACQYHEQALTIAQEIGDRSGKARHLGNLGTSYFALGEYQQARQYSEQALATAQESNDRTREGIYLGNLGNIYFALGEYQIALNYHEQALTIAQEIGDRSGEASCFKNLADVYSVLKQNKKSTQYRHYYAMALID